MYDFSKKNIDHLSQQGFIIHSVNEYAGLYECVKDFGEFTLKFIFAHNQLAGNSPRVFRQKLKDEIKKRLKMAENGKNYAPVQPSKRDPRA